MGLHHSCHLDLRAILLDRLHKLLRTDVQPLRVVVPQSREQTRELFGVVRQHPQFASKFQPFLTISGDVFPEVAVEYLMKCIVPAQMQTRKIAVQFVVVGEDNACNLGASFPGRLRPRA